MTSRALDANNDIFIDKSRIVTVSEGAQTAQAVRTRLLFYQGEWFLDITAGVPYFQDVLIKDPDIASIETLLKLEIINTEGVERLLTFASVFDRVNRSYKVEFSAITIYGKINQSIFLNVDKRTTT